MYLSENVQKNLRLSGVISENEAVIQEGDLYVAVNVVNNERRIISIDTQLLENKSTSKLLKG
jgi:hypothetical protein|tara:strand:- start:148 stop:333 length:186 start_codon:yes stop_codon:yes gene_type:complete